MIRHRFFRSTTSLLAAWLAFSLAVRSAWSEEVPPIVEQIGRIIPIALTGFSGETAEILSFDLYIAGFSESGPSQADFELIRQGDGDLEAILNDSRAKSARFHRTYPGGTSRARAHALADDVIEAITGRKGIYKYKIAYKVEAGHGSEIYVADYDGGNPIQLTRDGSIVAAPAWHPSRRMLYYTSYKSGGPDIFSHDLNSGTRRAVANFEGLNSSAAISPDGTKIAMILSKSGSPDLWVGNIDGTGLQQLTFTHEDESSPCWSPDGRTICFTSRDSGVPLLYTIPATGGKMQRLPTGGVANASEPDWSPDGKLIAFTHMSRGDNFELYDVPAGGGNAKRLTAGEDPSWAPNSRTLIFVNKVRYVAHLSLLDVPTGRVKDVLKMTGSCSQPSWSR
jgi:TolB protein